MGLSISPEMMRKAEAYFALPDNPANIEEDAKISDAADDVASMIAERNNAEEPFPTIGWVESWGLHSTMRTKWERIRKVVHPVPDLKYAEWKQAANANEEFIKLENDFRDRGLQVIVKLSSIELTPESCKYEGGSWHLEGMLNEHIAATAIYYYDVSNTTTSRIRFRQDADLDNSHDIQY